MAVKVIKKGEEGSHPIISNLVCMPPDNRSILKKIAELPKDQQKALLEEIIEKKYPEYGYEGIKYDWELNARPSQLIPFDLNLGWKTFIYNCGRGFGKLLDINTPIPTPLGWITMGALQVGDEVFDEKGNICKVTWVSEPQLPEKSYKFIFSDGAEIESCSEHEWVTLTHRDRKQYLRRDGKQPNLNNTNKFPEDWVTWRQSFKRKTIDGYENVGAKTRTTQEIVDTFYHSSRQDVNHCIPLAGSLKLPNIELPIDGYVYGLYLGDGAINTARITCHKNDYLFYNQYLTEKGFIVGDLKLKKIDGKETNTGNFKIEGLLQQLRNVDCLKIKKALSIYLRASENQRLQVLQALLDTDGCAYKNGMVDFCNTNKDIFDFALELAISLGQKPTVKIKIGKLYGVEKKRCYTFRFFPTRFDLFKLPRKLARLNKIKKSQQLRNHHRMISKFEEIEPKLMKCIGVDSPNAMYLAGKNMIPTHNSQTGSQWIINIAEEYPECRIALVGATAGDVLNTLVNGSSGIMNSCPPWNRPKWNPSYQKITFQNGSECEYFSSEKPARIRGRNFNFALCDEMTSWRFLKETWDMLSMALRIGEINRTVITTTPKNVLQYVNLLKNKTTWTYVGSSIENFENLSDDFRDEMLSQYAGTRLGQQELEAEILADDENALWKREWVDNNRVFTMVDSLGNVIPRNEKLPDFLHCVLAIDPAVSVNKKSAETAISVAAYGEDGKYYVLYADSYKDTPDAWAKRVYDLYDEYMCDSIIIETNQGGNLVVQNLKLSGRQAPIVEVRARRGKLLRAEPIAALYERNLVRHLGTLTKCESQMCNFNQHQNKELCDIVDSTVYALQALVDRTEKYYSNGAFYAVGAPREAVMTFRVV